MIKVLIVDDLSLIRPLMTTILSSDKDVEVVGTAQDPFDAREKIKLLKPDGARFICRVIDTEPVNRHKPSVEAMFKSAAEIVGSNSICVLPTGH